MTEHIKHKQYVNNTPQTADTARQNAPMAVG